MDGAEGNPALKAAAEAVAALALVGALACATAPPAASSSRQWVTGPRGRLRVDDGGQGAPPPVLFVHGNGGNRTQWKEQLDRLRPTRRAVAFDLHGMGESEKAADGVYSVESFGEDVAAVADALGLKRFVLVGHSYGGYVVAAYAGKHPERLAGLVFADCAGDFSKTPPEQLAGLRRGLEPDRYGEFTRVWFEGILTGARPETKTAVQASLAATPREVFTGATLSLYAFPMKDVLAAYKGPRLSIASMLAENTAAVHKSIPGIPFVHVEDASHWLMLDQPEAFDRFLDGFLASLR